MVLPNQALADYDDDELISVNKDEKENRPYDDIDDDIDYSDDEYLTPILLESMYDFPASPPGIFRIPSKEMKPDDMTVETELSVSDLYLPVFDSPSSLSSIEVTDDHSIDSYGQVQTTSPRNVILPAAESGFGIHIPADVQFHGQVAFSIPSVARRIRLQPRASSRAHAIFVPKAHADIPPHALADSISTGGGDGAEECKEEEDDEREEVSRDGVVTDDGFAYVPGDQYREEDYWGRHYVAEDIDYALEHSSVRGSPANSTYQEFGDAKSKAGDFQEFLDSCSSAFSLVFSCTHSAAVAPSPSHYVYTGGSFGAEDYGVSRADRWRSTAL